MVTLRAAMPPRLLPAPSGNGNRTENLRRRCRGECCYCRQMMILLEKRFPCSLIGEDEGLHDMGLGGSQKSLSRQASIGLG